LIAMPDHVALSVKSGESEAERTAAIGESRRSELRISKFPYQTAGTHSKAAARMI
jgi:hypothetical protein